MARSLTSTNNRIKLRIPQSLLDRLDEELSFLGIGSRILEVDDKAIASRNDFLFHFVVKPFVLRSWSGVVEPCPEFDEECGSLDYFLGKEVKGTWTQPVNDGLFGSYNDLATRALYAYFQRQEHQAESLAQQIPIFKEALKSFEDFQWRI